MEIIKQSEHVFAFISEEFNEDRKIVEEKN